MTDETRDFYMKQGASFFTGFNWYHESDPVTDPPTPGEPYELLDPPAMARMQVRTKRGETVLIDASSEGDDPFIILGAGGRVDITIPSTATDALIFRKARYDIEIVLGDPLPNGEPDVRRPAQGVVYVNPNITQDVP